VPGWRACVLRRREAIRVKMICERGVISST
jgi:hypothetical protein